MTTQQIVILIGIVAIIVIVAAARGRGPRVTTIERRVESRDDEDEGGER